MAAERLAKRCVQRTLIRAGFLVTLPGIVLLLVLVRASSSALAFVSGLIAIGAGAMLAPSINVVQSSFPDEKKCEISALPRAISNLGSSLRTAIAGTILVSGLASGNRSCAYAILALAADGLVGLVAAVFMRASPPGSAESASWRAVQQVRAPRVLIDDDALDAVGDVFEALRQA
jgi:predicted MFS family arabinose efflux permease